MKQHNRGFQSIKDGDDLRSDDMTYFIYLFFVFFFSLFDHRGLFGGIGDDIGVRFKENSHRVFREGPMFTDFDNASFEVLTTSIPCSIAAEAPKV